MENELKIERTFVAPDARLPARFTADKPAGRNQTAANPAKSPKLPCPLRKRRGCGALAAIRCSRKKTGRPMAARQG